MRPGGLQRYASDAIHAGVVIVVCVLATIYGVVVNYHTDNVWIVYGSSIAFAAGRAGAAVATQFRQSDNGPPTAPR